MIALQRAALWQSRGVFIFFVAVGCALGGICRYLGMTAVSRLCGEAFPWGTLAVNAVGSFLLGLVLGLDFLASEALEIHAFATIGFCGGLTTFSTFSLQNLTLVSQQKWMPAAWNIFGSALLCVFCVLSGYAIGEGVLA